MNAYKHITKAFESEYKARSAAMKNRLIQWRHEPTILGIQKPTNLARARSLGYKAKQGITVVRVKVARGLSKRPKPHRGRAPSKYGRFYAFKKSLQSRAEERAARKFSNCEVLNSYFVGEDGTSKFFEVILVDRAHPVIASDPVYSRIADQQGRVYRGLTSSGRKHRGIVKKGFGTNQNRPSYRARHRQIKV
ncbi:50S ribosomal protein L15e [uncultured archaeon]|nr:50S ribosomal protein L15e [uncultured archaeon]